MSSFELIETANPSCSHYWSFLFSKTFFMTFFMFRASLTVFDYWIEWLPRSICPSHLATFKGVDALPNTSSVKSKFLLIWTDSFVIIPTICNQVDCMPFSLTVVVCLNNLIASHVISFYYYCPYGEHVSWWIRTFRVFWRHIRWKLGGCGRCRTVAHQSGPARRSSVGSSPAAVARWRRLPPAGSPRCALNGGNKNQLAPSTHHYTGPFPSNNTRTSTHCLSLINETTSAHHHHYHTSRFLKKHNPCIITPTIWL